MLPDVGRRTVRWFLPAAALAGYAVMWLGYRQGWGWLGGLDSSTLRVGYDIGGEHPGWVRFWDTVCTVLEPSTFRVLGLVAAVALLLKHRARAALFVVVSVELSGLVTEVAKGLADRPRPTTAMVALPSSASSAFPSGHALGAMVGVVALLAVTLPALSRTVRAAAIALGALAVIMVGAGRVALNVHHLSDTLAGWALGYLYVVVCVRLLRPFGR